MKPTVLITGVSGGIGQAIAKLLSKQGWLVGGLDMSSSAPSHVDDYFQVDLADTDSFEKALTDISRQFPHLNSLIHNAAFQVCRSCQDTLLTEWDRVMAVNVRAPFWLTKQLLPLLQSAQGNIVHIASVHAMATSAGIAAYAASKGALISLTRAQAIDLAPDAIRVNAVLPGAVDTQMLDSGLKRDTFGSNESLDQLKKKLAEKTLMKKIGSPHDIAEAVYFLADNERAGFITGQTLVVDGGALACLSTE